MKLFTPFNVDENFVSDALFGTTVFGNENIVIFPEDSSNGYLEELEGFYKGFTALCAQCAKKGMDVPIYVTYFRKKDLLYIVDKPILYSQLIKNGETKEEVAERLLKRCNELGKMEFDIPADTKEYFVLGSVEKLQEKN